VGDDTVPPFCGALIFPALDPIAGTCFVNPVEGGPSVSVLFGGDLGISKLCSDLAYSTNKVIYVFTSRCLVTVPNNRYSSASVLTSLPAGNTTNTQLSVPT
jgi:hypothetical protein